MNIHISLETLQQQRFELGPRSVKETRRNVLGGLINKRAGEAKGAGIPNGFTSCFSVGILELTNHGDGWASNPSQR